MRILTGIALGATITIAIWRWHGEALHWIFSRGDVT